MIDFIFVYIILIHFLADFALQTNDQAVKKSSSVKYLLFHVCTYSLVWFIATLPILGWWAATSFASITFICHGITDYFTSRINKKFFDKQDLHNGFVGIGFDQVLHYLQLWFTFKLFLL